MMGSRKLTSEMLYKISALAGITIVLLAGYAGWSNITQLEPRAVRIFEQRVLADLDVRSLNTQIKSIEYAISESRTDNPEHGLHYSESELQALEQEAVLLRGQLSEQLTAITTLETEKNSIIAEVRMILAASILALTVGMVFAIFGCIAWYFHIQILEDRRTRPRI